MMNSRDDDFEMNFLHQDPEQEISMQELKKPHHALFDWAADGATDLMGEGLPDLPEEDPFAFTDLTEEEPEEAETPAAAKEQTNAPAPAEESKPKQEEPEDIYVSMEPEEKEPVAAKETAVPGRMNNGHVVLISGGDRGIGAAAVRRFWSEGYRTAFFYHTNEDAARALVNELGSDCVAVQCDVSDRAACEAAWKVVQRTVGDPDILVCNAGVAQQKLFTDITEADWQHMIGVDLTGVFHLCQLALPEMIRHKYGRILTVSSMWGQTGGSCEVHYSAAKAGVIGLTKALAKEEGPSGITVNCVAPGVIETDMMSAFTDEDKAALAEETPVQRLGTPDEVARMLTFLADEKAGFITGQILGVNGGLVI